MASAQFETALAYVKSLPPEPTPESPPITNDHKLQFYALFKQATTGANKTKAPSRLKVVEKFKWDAWKKLGNMSKEEAQKKYVQLLQSIAGDKWKDPQGPKPRL